MIAGKAWLNTRHVMLFVNMLWCLAMLCLPEGGRWKVVNVAALITFQISIMMAAKAEQVRIITMLASNSFYHGFFHGFYSLCGGGMVESGDCDS